MRSLLVSFFPGLLRKQCHPRVTHFSRVISEQHRFPRGHFFRDGVACESVLTRPRGYSLQLLGSVQVTATPGPDQGAVSYSPAASAEQSCAEVLPHCKDVLFKEAFYLFKWPDGFSVKAGEFHPHHFSSTCGSQWVYFPILPL